jgi:hypothetical protein
VVKKKLKFTLLDAMKAQEEGKYIAYSFFNLSATWDVWSMPCSGCCTLGTDPAPIVQEAEWAPGLVLTVVENLFPLGL